MSRHHCLPILPASELRHVFLGCDHFDVCVTTSCCDFDFLVAIVSVVFLPSYFSILCRDLMVMSRPLLFPIYFLLVATSVLSCNRVNFFFSFGLCFRSASQAHYPHHFSLTWLELELSH